MTRTVSAEAVPAERQVALVDLLDRLLAGGVVLAGDLTLRIADVDLVRIDLNALVSSVSARVPSPFEEGGESDASALPAPGESRGLPGEGA
ncbi:MULTISPECIES: gas vesicle protein [unclassified Streptomyces]|uniref:gas vesicle protein n=1 Tax=unclassified Streptomyces TaxID=2593676 RepID=UPI0033FF89AD